MINGTVAPGFEPVRAAFEANFGDDGDLGAGFAVVRDGAVLVELWGGHADVAQTTPWARDTLVPVFSVSKPVCALVIALLVDRGRLELDHPVAAYWPEFAAFGKDGVSLGDALAHKAGVPGFLDPIDPALWLDPPGIEAAIAGATPLWPPGTQSGYHPLTIGFILDAVCRRVDGRTLGAILREDICAPRGIDFHIGLADDHHGRCAQIKKPREIATHRLSSEMTKAAFLKPWSAPNRGGPDWRRAEIPSANGHGTAVAVARLYEAFADHGRMGGEQVFSSETIDALTQARFDGEDLVLPFAVTWAAGIEIDRRGDYGPNPHAFAHSGMGGAAAYADPDRGFACAYVMNKQGPSLRADPRATRLIRAVHEAMG